MMYVSLQIIFKDGELVSQGLMPPKQLVAIQCNIVAVTELKIFNSMLMPEPRLELSYTIHKLIAQ